MGNVVQWLQRIIFQNVSMVLQSVGDDQTRNLKLDVVSHHLV